MMTNNNWVIILSVTLLIFNCCSKDSDTLSIDDLRNDCSVAWDSPDDAYLRIINTLDVNVMIEYVDLPYGAHIWANSCELLGVFSNNSSAITIQQCESAGENIDGGPADCGDAGPTVNISYNLQSSETFEIIVDHGLFN